MWETVKSLIGSAAPMIGTVIGGPVGGAVGAMVASTLEVDNTPEAIEEALKSNPDATLKLKSLEAEHEQQLKKLALQASEIALEEKKAELADTQHARKSHKDHWMPSALTMTLAMMVAGMFAALFYFEPIQRYDQVVIMIAGSVLGGFGTAIAYWLGSSKGSADKSKQLKGG